MTESSPTTLSLVRQLWQQTWPMALGVMSLLGFYLVDSIFVARLGTALSGNGREQAGMGIAAGDLQGDGREDLMVTNFSGDANAVYLNEGAGMFRDQADPSGLGGPSRPLLGWGVAFLDADRKHDASRST